METEIKPINRRAEDFKRKKFRPQKRFKNLDPKHHPFRRAREYTRALNAVKLERVFAKPFLGSLSGSLDSIWRLCPVKRHLSLLAAGDCAGELRVWNVSQKRLEWAAVAHEGFVRGLSVDPSGDTLLTCGMDKTVRLWAMNSSESYRNKKSISPRASYLAKTGFVDADWSADANSFATVGAELSLWDPSRADPLLNFSWENSGATATTVNFSKVETNLLFTTASDRSVVLFDARTKSPAKKLVMKMVANSLSWNPMEAFTFTLASEDTNLYTFDLRNLTTAKLVHEDHLNAVMSVDYSPTGQEFVAGSYDRTVRIFPANKTRSREVYHTKRMQRIFATKFSLDGRFLFSGSDDTNIRIWKANASEKLGSLTSREKDYFNYCDKLKGKYHHMPEINKISRHRHLPKSIYRAKQLKKTKRDARQRNDAKFEKSTKQKIDRTPKKKEGILSVVD